MRYYISDLHFYHDNLNHRMDNRGFENAEAMNEYMLYGHVHNTYDEILVYFRNGINIQGKRKNT